MNKRAVGGAIVVGVVAGGAVIASCSFPTYTIIVGSGGGAATVSSGSGGASATASVGGGASASSGSASGNGGGSSTTTTTSTTTSATSSAGSGPCPLDADGDTFVSAQCAGGNDCADGDVLANINGDYHPFPIKNPQAGTPAYDFNCNGKEEYENSAVLDCTKIPCNTGTVSWKTAVPACGASAQYGVCKLGIASCTEDIQGSQTQKCK